MHNVAYIEGSCFGNEIMRHCFVWSLPQVIYYVLVCGSLHMAVGMSSRVVPMMPLPSV